MGVMKRISGEKMFNSKLKGNSQEMAAMRAIYDECRSRRPPIAAKPHKAERTANKSTALGQLPWIIAEASKSGLDVRYTYNPNGGTLHVMFNADGRRVLNWWPATGTANDDRGNRLVAPSAEEAIRAAVLSRDGLGKLFAASANNQPTSPTYTAKPSDWVGNPDAWKYNDGECPFEPGCFHEVK